MIIHTLFSIFFPNQTYEEIKWKKITIIQIRRKNFKLRQFYRQTFENFEVNKKKKTNKQEKRFKKIRITRRNKINK